GGLVVDVTRAICRALFDRRGKDARLSTRCVSKAVHAVIRSPSSAPIAILLNLSEDPGIRRRRSADHDGIAAGGRDHRARVFWRANVAIANDGNFDCIFDCRNPFPARVSAVTLLSRAGVQRYRAESAIFGDLCQLYADDLFVVPSGTELYG